MKSHCKTVLCIAAVAAVFAAQIAGCAGLHHEIKSLSDSAAFTVPPAIRYESVALFGTLDPDGTLFLADDGALYAVDAQYDKEIGDRFLLKFDTHSTETKTDDEILEVWTVPTTK